MASDTPSSEPLRPDRRQLLRGLGLGTAALAFPGVLAACGGSSGSGGSAGPSGSSAPQKVSGADISSLTWAVAASTIVGLDIASAFESNAQIVQICGLEGLLAVSDQLALDSAAGDELEVRRGGTELRVSDPVGREVLGRNADDGGRCRLLADPAHRPEGVVPDRRLLRQRRIVREDRRQRDDHQAEAGPIRWSPTPWSSRRSCPRPS